jgi:Tfp pilus assembly protein PilN
MIRINLLGETKDLTAFYAVQILVFSLSMFFVLGVFFVLRTQAGNEIFDLESKKENLETQRAQLAKKTKEVDGLDDKRKALAEKLSAIAKLKALKQSPVLVLDVLTKTIPERAWVKSIGKRTDSMDFTGVALDNQTISVFIKNLADSPFFSTVDLVYSKQMVQDGVGLKEFSLEAKLSDPLKANAELTKKQQQQEAQELAEEKREQQEGSLAEQPLEPEQEVE